MHYWPILFSKNCKFLNLCWGSINVLLCGLCVTWSNLRQINRNNLHQSYLNQQSVVLKFISTVKCTHANLFFLLYFQQNLPDFILCWHSGPLDARLPKQSVYLSDSVSSQPHLASGPVPDSCSLHPRTLRTHRASVSMLTGSCWGTFPIMGGGGST